MSQKLIRLALRSQRIPPPSRTQWLASSPNRLAVCRNYSSSDKPLPEAGGEQPVGPNMQQQEHVSEEAAKMAKITGGEGPDLSQGTPVQDILKEDKEAQKTAPKVLKDAIKSGETPPKPQTRAFSTYARRSMALDSIPPPDMQPPPPRSSGPASNDPADYGFRPDNDFSQESMASYSAQPAENDLASTFGFVPLVEDTSGTHKFGLPALPIPSHLNKKRRYDPVIDQVVNLTMRHGMKARAQRVISDVLQFLRTSSPPNYNAKRPLVPGAPPASQLNLNPALYLSIALDSLAPLMRINRLKGAGGGGTSLEIPIALGVRTRRRVAYQWILESALKKGDGATGRSDLARRIANEITAVVEGRSSLWEKRSQIHKLATVARSNITLRPRR